MALGFIAGRGTADQAPERGSTLGRAFEIGWKISGYIAWLILWRLGFVRRPSPAVRFARLLESLGTSFVKLGQHLSLRADVFPREYLKALQQLQDNVRPFPVEESIAAIERAFGKTPNLLFIRFDAEPLAAASVAQVHSARTFDGREVVVKVLRPGVAVQVERDMRILLAVVRFLCHFSPLLTRYRAEDVVREVRANLVRELDLRDEGKTSTASPRRSALPPPSRSPTSSRTCAARPSWSRPEAAARASTAFAIRGTARSSRRT